MFALVRTAVGPGTAWRLLERIQRGLGLRPSALRSFDALVYRQAALGFSWPNALRFRSRWRLLSAFRRPLHQAGPFQRTGDLTPMTVRLSLVPNAQDAERTISLDALSAQLDALRSASQLMPKSFVL